MRGITVVVVAADVQLEGVFMITELSADVVFPSAKLIGSFEPGSPEWHELRKNAVGGSQVGAILGLNPWESAVTAYYKATGEITDVVFPSMSMRLGTKLEAPILEIFAEEHPELTVFTTGTYAAVDADWQHANPDALYQDADGNWGIVEVKFSRDYWSAPPAHYVAQVRWYMRVLGIQKALIVALAGSTYQEFEIGFDQFEIDAMVQAVTRFRHHVEKRVQPDWDGSASTYETVRALNPAIDSSATEELGDLGMWLSLAKSDMEAAEIKYRELQSRTLNAMGSAKFGAVDDRVIVQRQQRGQGAPFLTWKK